MAKPGTKSTYEELEKQIDSLSEQIDRLNAQHRKLQEKAILERKQAEDAITTRLLYEQMLSACSQVLLASLEEAEALTETLYEFLVTTGVSRVYICKNFIDDVTGETAFQQTHEMCALQISPKANDPRMKNMPYSAGLQRWQSELSRGRPVFGTTESFLPEEHEYLKIRGAKAILSLPLWVEGHWYGFVGFDDTLQRRSWRKENIRLLQTGVDLVGGYIGRKGAEQALQESEEKYRTLIEQSTDAIFLIYGGRFELVNRRFTEMFGITPQEASAPDFVFTNILAPENKDAIAYLTPDRAQARKHGPPYEFVAIDKEGHRINVELTMSYPLYKRGLATQGIIRDISGRKRAEEEKRVAYEKVQQYADELALKISEVQRQREIATILAEVVSSVSLTLSTDELLTHILIRLQQLVPYDAAAVYMAGDGDLVLEAVHGYRADFVNPQESIAENVLFQEMHTKKSYILVQDTGRDTHFQMLFGTENVRSWIGAPLLVAQEIMGYMAVERHVPGAYTAADAELVQAFAHQVAQTIHNARLFTELKETQAQLVQRERLAALGQMAATVAHELRNPLMSLRMGIEYLTFDLPDEDPKHRAATLVESNMDRIARVVENILFVARTPRLTRISGSLHEMVENELAQWEYKLAENQITLRADLADDLPAILVDFDQMERVLSNLIGNATDAMESGGTLKVVLKGEDDTQIFTVSDTGSGINEETQAKIFEPFFTTKSRGTGLGLAIVKQIVESHGGQISVWSRLDQGTKFTVTLPQS